MTTLVIVLSLVGVLLHVHIGFIAPAGGPEVFTVGLFLLGTVPYGVALWLAARAPAWTAGALIVSGIALLLDLNASYNVFIAPTSSTESLALLVMPVVNLLAVLPLGLLAGWYFARRSRNPKG